MKTFAKIKYLSLNVNTIQAKTRIHMNFELIEQKYSFFMFDVQMTKKFRSA